MSTNMHQDDRRFALLIACDKYNDPKLLKLKAPTVDAYRFRKLLKNPDIGGYNDVKVLKNRPSYKIIKEVERKKIW
jgi:hypothetical protein